MSDSTGGTNEVLLRRLLANRGDRLKHYIENKLPPFTREIASPEDVLQTVLASAFRRIESFSSGGEAGFDRWIMTIANNKIRDCIRRAASRRRAGFTSLPAEDASSLGEFLQRLEAPGTTPSSEVATSESIALLHDAILELEPDQRKAIWLYEIERRSFDEVAAEMQKTRGAIRGLVGRGREQLRLRLGKASRFFSDADSEASR